MTSPVKQDSFTQPRFKDYRAPRQQQSILVDPPIGQASELVSANRRAGSKLPETKSPHTRARAALAASAIAWTAEYRSTDWSADRDADSIVMAGHQPTLFHPGVWLKNFALDKVAADSNALPINLIVDNDAAPAPVVGVPVRQTSAAGGHSSSRSLWQTENIAYSDATSGLPFEQTRIGSGDTFRGFADAVSTKVAPLSPNACVRQL